jgi:hypothetical protein
LLLKQSIRPYLPHQYKTINLISNDLVVMGPLTSILVKSVLSLCILSQGLKTSSDLRYVFAKKCSSIEPIIVSFNDGQEGGSKMSWATCCGLKKLDQKDWNDNNELKQKVQDKLKYCIQTWTSKKPGLVAIKIPEGFHGNSVRLLQERNKRSISLEYSSEKNIELDIDDKNHWAPRCIRAGITDLSNNNLDDFLGKTENATFGFFTVKIKEFKGIYLMAILSNILNRSLKAMPMSSKAA